jgi:hypothetical protein
MTRSNLRRVFAALWAASCYNPKPPPDVPCSDDSACPASMACMFGTCVPAGPPCTAIATAPGQLTVPMLDNPPVVDGDLTDWTTCFISVTPATAGEVRDLGADGMFAAGQFSVAADAGHLYIGAFVHSVPPLGSALPPMVYLNNSVSVYVDGDGVSTTATYDDNAAQIVVDHANREAAFRTGQVVSLPDVVSAAMTGSATFTIEMSITPASLGLTGFGSDLGFDIGLVGGDGTIMTSELVWYQACAPPTCGCAGSGAAPFCDAREFGSVVLAP